MSASGQQFAAETSSRLPLHLPQNTSELAAFRIPPTRAAPGPLERQAIPLPVSVNDCTEEDMRKERNGPYSVAGYTWLPPDFVQSALRDAGWRTVQQPKNHDDGSQHEDPFIRRAAPPGDRRAPRPRRGHRDLRRAGRAPRGSAAGRKNPTIYFAKHCFRLGLFSSQQSPYQ